MSNEDDLSTVAGMDALEAMTAEWWKECALDGAIAQVSAMVPGPFKERAFDNLTALMKQCYAEGLYRGFLAGKALAENEAIGRREREK